MDAPESAAVAARRQARRSWRAAGLALGALAVLAAAYGGYCYLTPGPPPFDPQGAEPAVVQAVEQAQSAVRAAPRSGWAWGELGMVLYANGRGAEADGCFARAEALEPEVPTWAYLRAYRQLLRDRGAALPKLRRAAALTREADPHNTTPDLVLADVLFEQGENGEADALCRQVLNRDPTNARAHFNLGLMRLAEDAPDRSIDHLTHAAVSPYTARRACLQLAAAYRRLGDGASAAAFLRRAEGLPEDRTWPDPYLQRAREYAAGSYRRAEEAEQLAAEGRHPEHLAALRELAEAVGDGSAHANLGMALARAGDDRAAEPVLRLALRQDPTQIGAHYALGIVLMRRAEAAERQHGDAAATRAGYRAAADCLRRAIERKPGHGPAHLYLGRCLRRLGEPDAALAELREAIRCRPDLAEGHLALGEALAEAGESAEAARHLRHAADLAPNDPRPRQALERLRGGHPGGHRTGAAAPAG